MNKLDHDNILRLIEVFKTSNNCYIVVQYCNGGDLSSVLEARGNKLEEEFARIVIAQIAKGLCYLAENELVHRDLKLDNILVNFPEYKESKPINEEYIRNFDYK